MPILVSSKKLAQRSALALIAIFLLLSGCGVPGPSGGGSSLNNGDDSDTEANAISVNVTIEATLAMMQRAIRGDSENIITVDDLNCSAISVVQLNYDFTELPTAPDLPETTATQRQNDSKQNIPGCKIEFTSDYEARVDAVVKVEYPNGDILYAPLRKVESEDQSIVVSFGPHLVLEKLFEQFNSSIELSQALPCVGTQPDCETQHRSKVRLLNFMAQTSRLYEFPEDGEFIVATDDKSDALAKLQAQPDLMEHIDTAVKEISREESPLAKGTIRDNYDPSIINAEEAADLRTRLMPRDEYNSVFFTMGLSDSATFGNLLTTASSHIDPGSINIYPRLSHTTAYLDIRYDDVLPNIPFEESRIRLDGYTTDPIVDPALAANRYSYLTTSDDDFEGSLINGTHLSNQGFFLNDRAINQTLTDAPTGIGDTGQGYDFNPVYYKLFRVNDYEPDTTLTNLNAAETPDYGLSPTWLTSAGFGRNSVFNIEQITAGTPAQYERLGVEESQYYFSWEVHGLQTSESISSADIDGKVYDVIEFSIEFDNASSEPVLVTAETLTWTGATNTFAEGPLVASPFYRTWELARLQTDASIVSRTEQTRTKTSRGYSFVEELESGSNVRNGLIYLDNSTRSRNPLGHISDNGSHFAFAIDDQRANDQAKRGIILANQQRSTNLTLTTEAIDFNLSGHYFFMDDDAHKLVSVNNSVLSLVEDASATQDCLASLQLELITIEHRLNPPSGEPNIVTPTASSTSVIPSDNCALDQGKVEIGFTVNTGSGDKALTLRGFAAEEDGDSNYTVKLINLLWLQDDALGLVFAQVDQNLSAGFDD